MTLLCRKIFYAHDAKEMAARRLQALGTPAAAECAVPRTGSIVW